jgi:aldehyde dehydrogenase (NAD(P)+)
MAAPVQLQAPNGVKWSQPTGLFIDNSFVKAASGETLTSIDPAYVTNLPHSPPF